MTFRLHKFVGNPILEPRRGSTWDCAQVINGLLPEAAGTTEYHVLVGLGMHTTPVTPWRPLIAAGVVLLALVAPLAKWGLAAGYFDAVFALVLSAAGAALVVVMVHAGFNAFHTGGKGFDKTHIRRDSINVLIDDDG